MAALEVRPVTSERWADLVDLFGERGASSGCSCMWFRLPPKARSAGTRAGNRTAIERLVTDDRVPGLLAYDGEQPVGWVSLAPRSEFERISGPPAEAGPGIEGERQAGQVWSVVCFFIRAGRRGKGVASALLDAAIEHARANGARVLEAYPIEPASGRTENAAAFTGLRTMFEKAGFRETGRFDRWLAVPLLGGPDAKRPVRPPGRPVMRLEL